MNNLPEIASKYLFENGIIDIFLSRKLKNFIYPHMRLLNLIDSNDLGLVEEIGYGRIVGNFHKLFFIVNGDKRWRYFTLKKTKPNEWLIEIIEKLKEKQNIKFIVDLSFVDLLFPSERASLINEIRDLYIFLCNYFLVSDVLYLTNNKGLKLGNHYKIIDYSHLNTDKIYLLDPNAETVMEPRLKPNSVYVIGGIVDKSNRLKGITSFLCKDYDVKRVRFEIFNNPWLISQKIDSIVKAMVLRTYNEVLDDYSALISVMNKEEIKRLKDFIQQKLK